MGGDREKRGFLRGGSSQGLTPLDEENRMVWLINFFFTGIVHYCKHLKKNIHRYTVVVPPELESGRLLSNGSWTGALGLIQRNVCYITNE